MRVFTVFRPFESRALFSVTKMKTLGTQSVPSQPTHAMHTYVLMNDVMDQGAVYKE